MANEKTPLLSSGEEKQPLPNVAFAPSEEYVKNICILLLSLVVFSYEVYLKPDLLSHRKRKKFICKKSFALFS
jgi:hypothetical protein